MAAYSAQSYRSMAKIAYFILLTWAICVVMYDVFAEPHYHKDTMSYGLMIDEHRGVSYTLLWMFVGCPFLLTIANHCSRKAKELDVEAARRARYERDKAAGWDFAQNGYTVWKNKTGL
jgi:hypothetical protein